MGNSQSLTNVSFSLNELKFSSHLPLSHMESIRVHMESVPTIENFHRTGTPVLHKVIYLNSNTLSSF